MSVILGIDPGPGVSGWCIYDTEFDRVLANGVSGNVELLAQVKSAAQVGTHRLAIEMFEGRGMVAGSESFESCVWIGRFAQAFEGSETVELVYRRSSKLCLCGVSSATDTNIRQALLDRFPRTGGGATPQIGTKAQPGPLYGFSTHAWPALAVCIASESGYGYVMNAKGVLEPTHPAMHSLKPKKK